MIKNKTKEMQLIQILRSEHRLLGLAVEGDDHCLWLLNKERKTLAIFPSIVDFELILKEADKYLTQCLESYHT